MYRRRYRRYKTGFGRLKIRGKNNGIVYLFLGVILIEFVINYIWIVVFLIGCYVVYKAYVERMRSLAYRNSGIDNIDKMDGIDFEKALGVLFRDLGYKVKVTPATGDFGADLIIEKSYEKTVVQAKRYGKPVGIKAVQEVIGALGYYNAHKALVVTNQPFTPQARKLAVMNNVKLCDRDELIRLLNQRNGTVEDDF